MNGRRSRIIHGLSWLLLGWGGPAGATPLSDATAAAIDALLAGRDPATSKAIFSTRDDATPRYVRDLACWAASLDLTPLSVWNSTGAAQRGGVLISPRHVLSAAHFPIEAGSTIRWVTRGNEVVERRVTASRTAGNTDIRVGLLDSAVPATISFAQFLPAEYAVALPVVGLPVVCTDQEKKIFVANAVSVSGGRVFIGAPGAGVRAGFFEDWIGGDSGSAGLLFVNGRPVVLLTATNPTNGPDYVFHTQNVAATMQTLGGGFAPQIVDLGAAVDPAPLRTRQYSGSVVIEPK